MLIKMSAYGFICHREAYLRDAWCQLDFVVVTLAWLPILFPDMGNYSVLRAFRALRPLRALKRVPGMPMLVQWILSVLPKMGNVLMLCGFVFLVFCIVGMELFKGALHNRCALPGFVETPGHPVSELRRLEEQGRPLPFPMDLPSVGLPTGIPTGAGLSPRFGRALKGAHEEIGASGDPQEDFDTGFACNPEHANGKHSGCHAYPPGTTCSYFDSNPNHGATSFDSVSIIFINYMQLTTFDDWANPMYALMDSFSPSVWVYFVLIVMLSGFFVVNLFLAVIFMEYGAAQEQIKLDQATARTARSGGSDEPSQRPTTDGESPSGGEHGGGTHGGGGGGGGGSGGYEGEYDALLASGASLSDGAVKVETPRDCLDCSQQGPCRKPFLEMAESAWLGNASTALVVVNMVLMCMPYEGMSAAYEGRLEDAATVISYIFIVEMAIKVYGLGCANYWSDGWNCLDGTIVSLSIVEIVLTALLAGMEGVNISFFRILRMLRMLRVLRILRLMRSWRGLYKIIMTFVRALPHMANLVFLIILTMFMFSLLGMQLFGGLFTEEVGYSLGACPGGVCPDGLEEKPYYHFDYIMPAMLTVFILLTGEWIDAMEPVTALMGTGVAAFFIFVVMLGKYLLMNLLVAVILTEFAEEDEAPPTERTSRSTTRESSTSTTRRESSADADEEEADEAGDGAGDGDGDGAEAGAVPPVAFRPQQQLEETDKSLYLFGPSNGLRRCCKIMIRHPRFDQVVILAIVVSSACLAIDSPRLDPNSHTAHVLKRMDLFFTALFFCEMSSKIIAFGFACNGRDSYLRSAWNQVDFVIVMISLVVLLADSIPQLRPLRVLRVMRVLRPLRLISRNAGMKLIITSLFKAMPAVSNVFGVILSLQLVFAILGMQMFSGKFGHCNNPEILSRAECVDGLSSTPLALPSALNATVSIGGGGGGGGGGGRRALKGGGGVQWDPSMPLLWTERPKTGSFDNFGDAMRLLYVMSSGDQWESPMFSMMGSTEPGRTAIRNDFSPMALFPIAWMFVGYIFAINLFVGVVVDNFSRMRKAEDGIGHHDARAAAVGGDDAGIGQMVPIKAMRPPENWLRAVLYRLDHLDRL